jgi:hypothetical protein
MVRVKAAPVTTDPQEFSDGSTKNVYKETFAIVGNVTNQAVQIVIKTTLYGIKDYIADIVQSYGQKGETKWVIDLDGQFLTNFDGSGSGVTAKWFGWHLMNGNGGAPTMAGRAPVGVGTITDQYGLEHTYSNNQIKGEIRNRLAKTNLPNIQLDVAIPANATSQTDGGSGKIVCGSGANEPTPGPTLKTAALGDSTPFSIESPNRAGHWVIKMV